MSDINRIIKLFGDEVPLTGVTYVLQLCYNSEIQEYLDSPVELNVGDVVYASGITFENASCYTVIDVVTGETATVTYLSSHSTCESCIKCNGIYYEFSGCSIEGTYYGISNQLLTINSKVQLNYDCYTVIKTTNEPLSFDFLAYYFPLCDEECIPDNNLVLAEGINCDGSEFFEFVSFYVNSTTITGQTVSYDFDGFSLGCGIVTKILSPSESTGKTIFLNSVNIDSCDSCNDLKVPLVVAYVNCNDSYTILYAIFTNEAVSNFLTGNTVFNFLGSDCYQTISATELCPFDQNYPILKPINFFTTCEDCLQPLSAGTETTSCNICDGVATTIYPPHATWTNNQGKAVVLLDTVLLGGNGWNS